MNIFKHTQPKTAAQFIENNLLVKHYAGSHAYGTSLPSSDVDFRGVFVADPINYLTPFFTVKEKSDSSEEDTKFYDLKRFFELVVDQNPNIHETLWVDREDIVFSTPAYEHLRNHRWDLLSAKSAFTYSGYAVSQLKKVLNEDKWKDRPEKRNKNNMHLVRLLRMGEEILSKGVVLVKRPDAEELLEIRAGMWTQEHIVEYAMKKEKYLREYLYQQTSLPHEVDKHKAANLFMEVLELAWRDLYE